VQESNLTGKGHKNRGKGGKGWAVDCGDYREK